MRTIRRRHPSDEELLRVIDDPALAASAPRTLAHVGDCPHCQQRTDALRQGILQAVTALRSQAPTAGPERDAARRQLERRLSLEARGGRLRTMGPAGLTAVRFARGSAVAVLAITVLITARALRSRSDATRSGPQVAIEQGALPIAALTPGATADVTPEQLCRGEHPGVEPADPAVRHGILVDYGMADVPQHEYELDYLITPELGGANDRRNLWPERYTDRTWNAKVKDQLEDLLPALVCKGDIDLRTAQQDIAANWVEAYKKYFKTNVPLRSGT